MAALCQLEDFILFLHIALFTLALSFQFVDAQVPFKPEPAGDSASVFIEGKAFYIQGGSIQNITTSQTFSISLSMSWNITNPTYTKLADGLYDKLFPNTLLQDGTTWFAICNSTFATYSISDGKITTLGPATMYSNFSGLSAVFDQGLGEVVVPNGFNNGIQTTNLYIAPGNLTTRENPLFPISEISVLLRYSLAWSEDAQKAFLFGGSTHSVLSGTLYQRDPSAFGVWNPINTTLSGIPLVGPTPREAACMVPAFNGTKLILFGGSGRDGKSLSNVALSDIFIYDIAKVEWTKGTDAGSTRARAAHACAVSGDALIVWGGFADLVLKRGPVADIAVYNLTAKQWVNEFISPNNLQTNPTSTPRLTTTTAGPGSSLEPTPLTSGSGNGNVGAIVGGVAAAVVVLAALGFLLWRRGLLKKLGTLPNVHHHKGGTQADSGGHNYKEQAEKIRGPHFDPSSHSPPQLVPRSAKGIRHPQLVTSQHERDLAAQMQLANGARHPQADIPQREHEYTARRQLTNGVRHPGVDIPQHDAGPYQQYQQNQNVLYDYREPVWSNRDLHGDLNAQSTSQSGPRSANGVRHPQLDIARRKQELEAEMKMLEYGSEETPTLAQRTEDWPRKRGGGSPYP